VLLFDFSPPTHCNPCQNPTPAPNFRCAQVLPGPKTFLVTRRARRASRAGQTQPDDCRRSSLPPPPRTSHRVETDTRALAGVIVNRAANHSLATDNGIERANGRHPRLSRILSPSFLPPWCRALAEAGAFLPDQILPRPRTSTMIMTRFMMCHLFLLHPCCTGLSPLTCSLKAAQATSFPHRHKLDISWLQHTHPCTVQVLNSHPPMAILSLHSRCSPLSIPHSHRRRHDEKTATATARLHQSTSPHGFRRPTGRLRSSPICSSAYSGLVAAESRIPIVATNIVVVVLVATVTSLVVASVVGVPIRRNVSIERGCRRVHSGFGVVLTRL
ncbi:hypothetical protein C8F01DRAFT_1300854, partial [Mycena amicta]